MLKKKKKKSESSNKQKEPVKPLFITSCLSNVQILGLFWVFPSFAAMMKSGKGAVYPHSSMCSRTERKGQIVLGAQILQPQCAAISNLSPKNGVIACQNTAWPDINQNNEKILSFTNFSYFAFPSSCPHPFCCSFSPFFWYKPWFLSLEETELKDPSVS